uniref:vascular endothelial growth factor C-like isoform X2 n=1 Tax=Myxine glutinosa TaxID=7769 RepID=UPI00358FFF68
MFLAFLVVFALVQGKDGDLGSGDSSTDNEDIRTDRGPWETVDTGTIPKGTSEPKRIESLAQRLLAASSVDDFLALLYPRPEEATAQRCRRGHRTEPQFQAAAVNINWEAIELEWSSTLCAPRQACVPTGPGSHSVDRSLHYRPPCVSLHRCTGCCNDPRRSCTSTAVQLVSKTVIEISLFPELVIRPVTISYKNHTECHCLTTPFHNARPPRSLSKTWHNSAQCGPTSATCAKGTSWNIEACRCVAQQGEVCGPGMKWNEELCNCVCWRVCPRGQRLQAQSCGCECALSTRDCFLRARRFDLRKCRCVTAPCPGAPETCPVGLGFSEELCRCVPQDWIQGLQRNGG